VQIIVSPNEKGTPVGKLADAEVQFDRRDGQAGVKQIDFE